MPAEDTEGDAVPRFMSRQPSEESAGTNYVIEDAPDALGSSSASLAVPTPSSPVIHVVSEDPAHDKDIDLSSPTSALPEVQIAREENHKLVDSFPSWAVACKRFGCTEDELLNAAKRRLQINYGTSAWYDVMLLRRDGEVVYDRKAELAKVTADVKAMMNDGNCKCCTIL